MKPVKVELTIPAKHHFLSVLGTAVSSLFEKTPFAETQAYNMQLAIHEACANVVDHAYSEEDDGYVTLTLTLEIDDSQFTTRIEDNGRPLRIEKVTFPPESSWQCEPIEDGYRLKLMDVPEPDLFQERGRGLFLMRQLLDEIIYLSQPESNQWQLRKDFNNEK